MLGGNMLEFLVINVDKFNYLLQSGDNKYIVNIDCDVKIEVNDILKINEDMFNDCKDNINTFRLIKDSDYNKEDIIILEKNNKIYYLQRMYG